jgi:hypothetical protein
MRSRWKNRLLLCRYTVVSIAHDPALLYAPLLYTPLDVSMPVPLPVLLPVLLPVVQVVL